MIGQAVTITYGLLGSTHGVSHRAGQADGGYVATPWTWQLKETAAFKDGYGQQ